MSAKHTPRPWVWHKHDEETWRIYGTAQLIDGPAEGCYCVADVINGNGYEQQNAANRDLIAAAPQLLEALEEAVASGMVPVSSAADGGAVAYSRVVRAADQIRAAIKAAKGAA